MIVTCIGIFGARFLDVTIGTIKTYYMIKNKRLITTALAFFEVFVWFLVAKSALSTNLNKFLVAISYAGGYAFGTFAGMFISSIITHEIASILVITKKNNNTLLKEIKENGYGLTVVPLKDQKKEMYFITTNSLKSKKLINRIRLEDKKAFITILNIEKAYGGYFSP